MEDSEDLSADEKDKDEEVKETRSIDTSDDEDYVSGDEGAYSNDNRFLEDEKEFKKSTFALIDNTIDDNQTSNKQSTS